MITTTYQGPTDTRGSRIVARHDGRQLTLPYDYASSDPHTDAAREISDADVVRTGETARGYRFEVTQ